MFRRWVWLAALLPAAAIAGTVTIDFSGTIYSVDYSVGALLSTISVGDHYTAEIQYDSTTPGFPFSTEMLYNPTNGSGYFSSFTADINGHIFQSSANYYGQYPIQTTVYQFDELRPIIPAFVNLDNTGTDILELDLGGGSHSLALPTTLSLSDYTFKDFRVGYFPNSGFLDIHGSVDQLSTSFSEAPEPSTIPLIAGGLLLGVFCYRRKILPVR